MNNTSTFRNFFLRPSYFLLITSLMPAAFAADISDVIVRQQWPWSTDVKVEYKLTNVTVPVRSISVPSGILYSMYQT